MLSPSVLIRIPSSADNEDFEGVVDYVLENGGFFVSTDFNTVDYAVDVLEMSINKYSSLN